MESLRFLNNLEPPLTLILSPEGRGNKRIPSPDGERARVRGYSCFLF
jgi:hypothetical protein